MRHALGADMAIESAVSYWLHATQPAGVDYTRVVGFIWPIVMPSRR